MHEKYLHDFLCLTDPGMRELEMFLINSRYFERRRSIIKQNIKPIIGDPEYLWDGVYARD